MINIGSKVICVYDRFPIQVFRYGSALPMKGCIYTVQRMLIARDGITGIEGPAFVLCELHNPLPSGGDLSFATERFEEIRPDETLEDEVQEEEDLVLVDCVS